MLSNKIKSLTINLSLAFFSLILAIAAAEIVLRFTDFASILDRSYAYPTHYFVADQELGYDIGRSIEGKKHTSGEMNYGLFSNSYGCFDYEREVPEDYGLIVGDSFTWGYTPLDKKWTTRLEELSGVFMLKCGVTGYGTKQELIKARKVIEAVGKKPKFLVVMHTSNDLHDDFLFPHRTVIGGHIVGSARSVDLLTGDKHYFGKEELLKKFNKYVEGSLRNRLRKLRYDMVTYRLYRYRFIPFYNAQRERLKAWLDSPPAPAKQPPSPAQPVATKEKSRSPVAAGAKQPKPITMARPRLLPIDGRRGGAYDIPLHDHLDDFETPWYQEAIADHIQAIENLKDYAQSMDARLLFIDIGNFLGHPRFAELRRSLGESYYSLASDYPVHRQAHWKYDRHWNIEGNQKAGEYIYNRFQHALESGH